MAKKSSNAGGAGPTQAQAAADSSTKNTNGSKSTSNNSGTNNRNQKPQIQKQSSPSTSIPPSNKSSHSTTSQSTSISSVGVGSTGVSMLLLIVSPLIGLVMILTISMICELAITQFLLQNVFQPLSPTQQPLTNVETAINLTDFPDVVRIAFYLFELVLGSLAAYVGGFVTATVAPTTSRRSEYLLFLALSFARLSMFIRPDLYPVLGLPQSSKPIYFHLIWLAFVVFGCDVAFSTRVSDAKIQYLQQQVELAKLAQTPRVTPTSTSTSTSPSTGTR